MELNLNETWEKNLELLKGQVLKPSFETWLRNARPMAFYDSTMVVAVPNQFARDWIQSRYSSLIRENLRKITGGEINLEFVVLSKEETPEAPEYTLASNELNGRALLEGDLSDNLFRPLNPKYTFDSFVIGNSNSLAHAAALAVAESPARAYNPLFIYGGVGLGKTHLMHAIGNFVQQRSPHLTVGYVTSETFTNELINSIRDDKAEQFRSKYRHADVLLVDDIQFLAGKERTQEEFFHTFNALYEANRQLVISSDRPPREIPTLEERLRSRFEWGLISDIQKPDLETRIAILRKKAKLEDLMLPDDVLVYIASHIDTNIRELEGALIRVVAYSSLTKRDIDSHLAAEALREMLPSRQPKRITATLIQELVAKKYDLSPSDLKEKKRTRSVAFPRHVAMYLCRELTDLSLPRIGEEFGGRDHTTVLHACEKVGNEIKNDPELKRIIDGLIADINAS